MHDKPNQPASPEPGGVPEHVMAVGRRTNVMREVINALDYLYVTAPEEEAAIIAMLRARVPEDVRLEWR